LDKEKNVVCTRCLGGVLTIPDVEYLEGFRYERCGCRYTNEDLNIPLKFYEKTFDNYYNHEKLIKTFRAYVNNYQNEKKGYYLHGPVGVGKTHLALSLLKELAKVHGIRGKYITVVDFLQLKRRVYDQQQLEQRIIEFEQAEFLVFDDIGVEKVSTWVEEQITSLIDFRYRNELKIIFTSNYSLEELKNRFEDMVVGYRITSRIAEMCISCYIEYEDYRFKDAKELKYG